MTLFLSASDVDDLLNTKEVIDAVEQAHADLATGVSVQPPITTLDAPGSDARFLPMTAVSARHDLAVVKFMADIPSNRDRGLPAQRSMIMVNSASTGECLAVIDGKIPTRDRTAAASAVASRHLARPDSSVLGLVGAGQLAREHVAYLSSVLPIERVVVWSRSAATVQQFRDDIATEGLPVSVVGAVREVFDEADVVCTLTPSRTPIIDGRWFRPGQHINAVGAPPRADHREIDSYGMARATIVVDDYEISIQKSGDSVLALADGTINNQDLRTELGQVITGAAAGRTHAEQITLYNSVGVAIQDLAIARLLIERAREWGKGLDIG
jgi:ornithine cyclodeaminase/alanine dehydrogenase